MSVVDPIAGLVAYLRATPVAGLAGGRVFRPQLPGVEVQNMPRACVVLRASGGVDLFAGGYQQIGTLRVDVVCYGESAQQAFELWTAVRDALKQMTRQVQAGVRLHWCRPSAGPLTVDDPDTQWPYCMSSWQLMAGETAGG